MVTWKQFGMNLRARDTLAPVLSEAGGNRQAPSVHIVRVAIPGSTADWTRAVAIAFANGADAVLTLADNVQITEHTFGVLVQALSMYPDAILGGRIFDAARPYYVLLDGYCWSASGLRWQRESYIEAIPDPTAPPSRPAPYLSSAALAIPRGVWDAVGGFDERFGSFLGDADFCLRAKRQGFKCLVIRDARFSTTRDVASFDVSSDLACLHSTLLLARLHRIPCGMVAMAWRHSVARITEELDLVDYWAEYGTEIDWARRTLWYLRGCFQAMRRARLRVALRQIFVCAWASAWAGARVNAR